MQIVKAFFLVAVLALCVGQNAMAQKKDKNKKSKTENLQEGEELSFGMPISEFPLPPNQETATALVNYQLDNMGLNAGKNDIHYDEATGVKMYAYYNPHCQKYTLYAAFKETGKEIPVKVEPFLEHPGCIYATIGDDWVNVLCSDKFRYAEEDEVRNTEGGDLFEYPEGKKEKTEKKKEKSGDIAK